MTRPGGRPLVAATFDWTAGLRPRDAPRTHRLSVRGLVTDLTGRVLFVETGGGHLMLPGGGVEDGESETECLRREVAEETGVVIDTVGDVLGTCTELNPDRDGVSTWALECRYLAAATAGATVAPNLSGYEVDLGLRPRWLPAPEGLAALVAQVGTPGRPGCWAQRDLPIVAAWHAG